MTLVVEAARRGLRDVHRRLRSLTQPSSPTNIEPAKGEIKQTLEEDCQKILDKEDFGRVDFDKFIANTIHLIGGLRFKGSALYSDKLRDDSAKVRFNLNTGKFGTIVEVRGDPVEVKPGQLMEMHYENLTYATRERYPESGRAPELHISGAIKMPESLTFDSYLGGGSYPFFPPEAVHRANLRLPSSDQQVQRFCRRIFTLYQQGTSNPQA